MQQMPPRGAVSRGAPTTAVRKVRATGILMQLSIDLRHATGTNASYLITIQYTVLSLCVFVLVCVLMLVCECACVCVFVLVCVSVCELFVIVCSSDQCG
jgi:hypothetical protein